MKKPEVGIQKIKDKLILANVLRQAVNFSKKTTFLVFIVAIIMLSYCVYIWYQNIYRPNWSEDRKEEYKKSKDRGTTFNKKGFEVVVNNFETRKNEMEKVLDDPVDIFRLNK